MRALKRLFARVGNFAMRRSGDQRLREEIEEHLALQIEENIRAGLSPVEARRHAMLKLGSVEAIRESSEIITRQSVLVVLPEHECSLERVVV
jgi:hypothetical protein